MNPKQGRDGPRDARARRSSEFGKRLTAARLAAGLTQEQLADRLGVSLSAIVRWEHGDASPVGKLVREAVERFLAGK